MVDIYELSCRFRKWICEFLIGFCDPFGLVWLLKKISWFCKRIYWIFQKGAKFPIPHVRTGFYPLDFIFRQVARFFQYLVNYDTKTLYSNRATQALQCRVENEQEALLADFFTINSFKFIYEPQRIKIGDEWYVPDFYLKREKVYVEYWGWADRKDELGNKYRAKMKIKLAFYRRNKIPVVSIYPRHMQDLAYYFTRELQKTLKEKGGSWIKRIWLEFCGEFINPERKSSKGDTP